MSDDLERIIQQSINLYQAEFQPKKELMNLWHCSLSVLVFFLVLAGFSWHKQQELLIFDDKLNQLSQSESQLSSQIFDISQVQRKKLGAGIHDEELELKESDLKARKELLESLVGDVTATTEGFSEYLSALARQHISGSWITGLSIEKGGEDIAISGNVLSAALAPEYLIKLADESIFRGKSFDVLEVNTRQVQVEGNTLLAEDMRFLISTKSVGNTGVSEVQDGS